jgi:hypothetical protein
MPWERLLQRLFILAGLSPSALAGCVQTVENGMAFGPGGSGAGTASDPSTTAGTDAGTDGSATDAGVDSSGGPTSEGDGGTETSPGTTTTSDGTTTNGGDATESGTSVGTGSGAADYPGCYNVPCPGNTTCLVGEGLNASMTYCAPDCVGPDDPSACPTPATGDAVPRCIVIPVGGGQWDMCALDCSAESTCPDGMTCVQETDLNGPIEICMH